ncbi:MAG: carbohydrate ABC transporter permease [Chloroflexales bacterium]|nr:carbohydrate ABC transporter permease [Chloroflexales bacterium]
MQRSRLLSLLAGGALALVCAAMLFPIVSTVLLSLKGEADVHTLPPRLLPCDPPAPGGFLPTCRFVGEGYGRVALIRPADNALGLRVEGRILTTYLPNTLLYATSSALLVTLVSALSAYAYSRFRFRGRQALLLGTILIGGVPLLTMLLALTQVGNTLRRALPVYDDRLFMVVVYVGFELPFAIWVVKGFFDTIPRELEEAALIDGCSPVGALARVVAPLALPGLLSIFLLCFVGVWNDFTLNYVLLNKQALRGAIYGIYAFIASSGISYNALAAACVIVMLPPVAVFLLTRRAFFVSLVEGGLKG